jgi:hypothetical protein
LQIIFIVYDDFILKVATKPSYLKDSEKLTWQNCCVDFARFPFVY